jgi:AAA+ ATPase superfamily predicted ATPase
MRLVMKAMLVKKNSHFIGREFEQTQLKEIAAIPEASIIVIYGRRRVGKTELIEQTYHDRHLLKFEGIEGEDAAQQRKHVLLQLAKYTQDPLIAQLQFNHWTQIFELIAKYVKEECWTLYFEETQWLACYQNEFIAELKYVWDNHFRHNSFLKIILCGSSPSFMINQVMHSKALYSRSMYEMNIQPFTLQETQAFLPKCSQREIMNAYLTIGGIPEYLKRIKNASSLLLGISKNSFERSAYFSTEYKKIFISSLSNNKHYKNIIDLLSKRRFMSRPSIAKALKTSPGGQLSDVLNDLVTCGFIAKYTPYHQKTESLLARYCIQDRYLDFYFKFIAPIKENIAQGNYDAHPIQALDLSRYQKWLGFAFERYCRDNHAKIAQILGFSAVRYRSGVYFNRNTDKVDPGFQIDLVFDRADNVMTVCEIKYLQRKVGIEVISEFEQKLLLMPTSPKTSIQKVLISTEGANDSLIARAYFDRFITLEEFF